MHINRILMTTAATGAVLLSQIGGALAQDAE